MGQQPRTSPAGLDTNVLVRYIMQDDPKQSIMATQLIESLDVDGPGFVTLVSIIELYWVLTSCYKLNAEQVNQALMVLLQAKQIVVDRADQVLRALRVFENSKADFADCLSWTTKKLPAVQATGSFAAGQLRLMSSLPNFAGADIGRLIFRSLPLADKRMPPNLRDLMHSRMADDRNLHPGATYVPFIVERLFPVFMRSEGKDLKAYKIALPERERELNVHLKLLREMKDVAHRTQSAWLAACWVNYRNLYLSQTNGKAWCEKYLRNITPTEVRFA
jgi:predicted nucleic-acid-binding protein